jgi:hypothetical protein
VRIGEDKPGEGNLLRLSRRQRVTARTDDGVQHLRQHLHPFERIDGCERLDQLLLRGRRPREPEVLRDRADEDVLLLRDESDFLAERVQRQVDEPDTSDLDEALTRRVNAGE